MSRFPSINKNFLLIGAEYEKKENVPKSQNNTKNVGKKVTTYTNKNQIVAENYVAIKISTEIYLRISIWV